MGIYIKDMEMPKSCNECRFAVNGVCCVYPCPFYKAKTNGDVVRAMTDEELAEWVASTINDYGFEEYKELFQVWFDWLKQEAKE